jgi:hypothetical protein
MERWEIPALGACVAGGLFASRGVGHVTNILAGSSASGRRKSVVVNSNLNTSANHA